MPARVIAQHRGIYRVVCEKGMMYAKVTGKLLYDAAGAPDFPAVGDWVMVETDNDTAAIHRILPRKSVFVRRAAGVRTRNKSSLPTLIPYLSAWQ
jgi:ribosome biogenesis GTPase